MSVPSAACVIRSQWCLPRAHTGPLARLTCRFALNMDALLPGPRPLLSASTPPCTLPAPDTLPRALRIALARFNGPAQRVALLAASSSGRPRSRYALTDRCWAARRAEHGLASVCRSSSQSAAHTTRHTTGRGRLASHRPSQALNNSACLLAAVRATASALRRSAPPAVQPGSRPVLRRVQTNKGVRRAQRLPPALLAHCRRVRQQGWLDSASTPTYSRLGPTVRAAQQRVLTGSPGTGALPAVHSELRTRWAGCLPPKPGW